MDDHLWEPMGLWVNTTHDPRMTPFSFHYRRQFKCPACGLVMSRGPSLCDDEVARVMAGEPFQLEFGAPRAEQEEVDCRSEQVRHVMDA